VNGRNLVLKILTLSIVLGHVYVHEGQSPLFIGKDLGTAQDLSPSVVLNKKLSWKRTVPVPCKSDLVAVFVASDTADFRYLGPISKLSMII
jgi:hypothetical protein